MNTNQATIILHSTHELHLEKRGFTYMDGHFGTDCSFQSCMYLNINSNKPKSNSKRIVKVVFRFLRGTCKCVAGS